MDGGQVGQDHTVQHQGRAVAGEERGSGQAAHGDGAAEAAGASGVGEGAAAAGLAGKLSGPFWPQADNSTAPTNHPPQQAARQAEALATLEQDFICGF